MRKLATLFAASALVFFVGGAASAKTSPKLSGTVTHVDLSAKTFAVKQSRIETSFKLSPMATIMSGYKTESLAALKVGDKVSVTYTREGSNRVANRIEIASASKTAPMKSSTSSKAPGHSSY
jgi:Cu/Ag efflux protein CusF